MKNRFNNSTPNLAFAPQQAYSFALGYENCETYWIYTESIFITLKKQFKMSNTLDKKALPTWVSILLFIAIMTAIMVIGMMI